MFRKLKILKTIIKKKETNLKNKITAHVINIYNTKIWKNLNLSKILLFFVISNDDKYLIAINEYNEYNE